MKKLIWVVTLFAMSLSLATCGQRQTRTEQNSPAMGVVKVLYFHGSQRCATCRALEANTIELLETEYAQAQNEGKIVFKSIDFSESEGEAVADRYEVAWSSLILDKEGTTADLTDMGFRYARTEPETFKANLKQELDKMLH